MPVSDEAYSPHEVLASAVRQGASDAVAGLVTLVDGLRPPDPLAANRHILGLCHALGDHTEHRLALEAMLDQVLSNAHSVIALTESGLATDRGLASGVMRRIWPPCAARDR